MSPPAGTGPTPYYPMIMYPPHVQPAYGVMPQPVAGGKPPAARRIVVGQHQRIPNPVSSRAAQNRSPSPPPILANPSQATFSTNGTPRGTRHAVWVGNLPENVTQEDMKTLFQNEEYESIFITRKHKCAFVNFVSRQACESAIERVNGVGTSEERERRRVD